MSGIILSIASAMFLIPLFLMVAIAVTGTDIPGTILLVGGWSMALGLVTAGIGAFMALAEG